MARVVAGADYRTDPDRPGSAGHSRRSVQAIAGCHAYGSARGSGDDGQDVGHRDVGGGDADKRHHQRDYHVGGDDFASGWNYGARNDHVYNDQYVGEHQFGGGHNSGVRNDDLRAWHLVGHHRERADWVQCQLNDNVADVATGCRGGEWVCHGKRWAAICRLHGAAG